MKPVDEIRLIIEHDCTDVLRRRPRQLEPTSYFAAPRRPFGSFVSGPSSDHAVDGGTGGRERRLDAVRRRLRRSSDVQAWRKGDRLGTRAYGGRRPQLGRDLILPLQPIDLASALIGAILQALTLIHVVGCVGEESVEFVVVVGRRRRKSGGEIAHGVAHEPAAVNEEVRPQALITSTPSSVQPLERQAEPACAEELTLRSWRKVRRWR